uniref:Myomesin 1 n=2 Tax=Hucho hucho TaxID=62062 RepID=A0A4W5NMM3_9TELE
RRIFTFVTSQRRIFTFVTSQRRIITKLVNEHADPQIYENEEYHKCMNEDSLMHAPEFVIKPRSHTVWEKQCVRLHCTVSGWPDPRVVWYKNNVTIDPMARPGKYKLQSNGLVSEYGITFETHIVDGFGVSFGREGETMSLGAMVIISPNLARYQPEVQWYRDDVLLQPSKWCQMHWSGDKATLTLTHLNKEDEGLYTLRITTKTKYETYSAYVFVRDADAEVEGAPGAPLDVTCQDANKDYVIVTWKQPAVDGGNSILGYFVDRCEVGTTHWSQCNDTPIKFARFPVAGLVEGRSYTFRVRAVNKSGMSRPSRTSEVVAAMDPADRARMRGMVEGVVPGRPKELEVTEATKNYVVLSWKPPGERGHEGIMYYVEKCVSGTDSWQRVNTEIPVKSPRYALFDLAEGKAYRFRVRCCNSAGVGEPSEATEATTVGDKLDIPSAPGRVVPTRNTDTSVVVSWEASRNAKELVGYYIEASIVGSKKFEPCNNKPVKATRFICHGLVTGESYVFRVKALNAAGLSECSQESEAIEVKAAIASPTPPYGISILECVRDSMVLAWKQPTFIGGADITGYFVDYREVINGVPGKWHEANVKAVSDRAYRVSDLKENRKYQFQVRAANMAGVGIPSLPSETFVCEEWTIAVPGPPHDLQVTEVRANTLVLLYKPPVYQGRDPVKGFYIDIKEADAEEEAWRGVNEKAISTNYMKVRTLSTPIGQTYVFRVRAQNKAGVGKASEPTEPVLAETKPGTTEIVVDIDDDGVISMNFACSNLTPDSKFVWSKNYKEITDETRITVATSGEKSKAIFNMPAEDDIGIYSCAVTHTNGESSSYTLSAEELKKLLEISHDHKFPIIPLKTELAVELQEKGRVRFWLQAEKISANGKIQYVFNDNTLSQGEMNFNKDTGVIEMIMESLLQEDEGTFTFQLQDGKATNQSSLVLIGEGRINSGPHFVEYLSYEVTPECCVFLKCKVGKEHRNWYYHCAAEQHLDSNLNIIALFPLPQVGNIKKETVALWYKDGREVKGDGNLAFTEGVLNLEISQVRGILKRGLFCRFLYTISMALVSFTDRIKSGVVGEQLWLQITEPTEKDKGKYAIEFHDGKGGLKRTVELAGQGETTSWPNLVLLFSDRARVAGGLPDVVTIQELKALNLTCNISGDPMPEVVWLKNEREIVSDDHYIMKFESGKYASFTITTVNTTDSGKYSILVKNKYGTESADFTISVFSPDSKK